MTSPRHDMAVDIASFCTTYELTQPYGGYVGKSTDPTHRRPPHKVLFCKPEILDGVVEVYGENFVRVKWQTAIRVMPRNGSRVFGSADDAKQFIKSAFVDFNRDKADDVPFK